MVSFDVASLFTNIPLKESIDLTVSYITEGDTKSTFSKAELVKMFSIATSQTHFLFNGKVFDQIDGVTMGSPLAPVMANLFLGHHEIMWLKTIKVLIFSIADMLMIFFVFSTMRMMLNCFLTLLAHNIQISHSL